jgi:type VI secretion system secreted protein VgrG
VGVLSMLNAANSINEAVGGNKTETVGVAKVELLGGSKTENIGLAKQLTSGAVALTTGKDMSVNTQGVFAATAAGPMKETCGEAYALTAKQVQITAAAGAKLKAGGTEFALSGGTLTLDASSFQGDGSVNLALKGPINYQDP